MTLVALRPGAFSPALAAEFENLSLETDPALRDQALLGFAHRLEQAGWARDARSIYLDLSQSSDPQVKRSASEQLVSRSNFGLRVEGLLARGSRILAHPSVFLPLALGGLLLRMGATRLGQGWFTAALTVSGVSRSLTPRLALPALGLLAGCQRRSNPQPELRGVREWSRHESLEINGNSSVGEITYIRQAHSFPGLNSGDMKEITEYQRHIFKELKSVKAKHVFLESFTQDWGPRSQFQTRPPLLQMIRNVFPQGVPSDLNPQQAKLLLEEGGGMVYAALHDEVEVHKTWTEVEALDHYDRLVKGTGREALDLEEAIKDLDWIVMLEKNRPEVTTVREELAKREVMDFLGKNPGTKAALIFGAAHEFKDDFEKLEKPPTLHSVEWRPN